MHAVVQSSNSKHFHSNALSFQINSSYSYILVTLQLHIVKNDEFKKEEIIAFWKI